MVSENKSSNSHPCGGEMCRQEKKKEELAKVLNVLYKSLKSVIFASKYSSKNCIITYVSK